jgi:hypothetical protein
MTTKLVGSIGLILDIIGVCILFKFGFPQPDLDGGNKLIWGKDPSVENKRKKYVAMSVIGLVCLIAGFCFQLLAIWL